MTPSARRRLSRIGLALCLVAPLGIASWWLSTRSEPPATRFDEALDRALLPVMEQREVQQKLRAPSSKQARLIARDLARRSVPYLAPRDLELWAATRERVARASPGVCARLWKGGDDAFLGPAIADLGDDALEAYVAMLARGFALRLERKPPPSVEAGSIQRGFAAAARSLEGNARVAFERDVERPDVSDARACELFLRLSSAVSQLEPRVRTDYYRALAAQLTPPT